MKSIIAIALCIAAATCVRAQSENPPNILFIFCDDLNLLGLGSEYNGDIVTPVLDSLVNAGVTFTNAFANATICGPSRASVLTGVHPISSGHYGYQMGLNDWRDNQVLSGTSTIFNHLEGNGYDVFATGKIFHGTRTPVEEFTQINVGPSQGPWAFDKRIHSSLPEGFAERDITFSPLEDIPSYPEYTGWVNRDGSPFYFGSSDDRDLLGDELSAIYCDSLFTALGAQNQNPFFLTVGFFNPHEPFHVPQEYFDLYNLDSLSLEEFASTCDLEVIADYSNRWNSKSNYDTFDAMISESDPGDSLKWIKEYVRGYYASVSFLDDQIGKVIGSLKENNLDENTIIVISSDHGFQLGRKCSVRKTLLNSEASSVPLIILGPDLEPQIVETPASLVDLYPTFCEWAGIAPPENQLDGTSLIPIINGSEDNVAIISVAGREDLALNQPGTATRQHHSVVFDQFKLNLHSSGEYQLFERFADPFEMNDLSKEPGYHSIVLKGVNHLSNFIPEENRLENVWERLYYGNFLNGLEAWEYNESCEFGSFFEGEEFLQNQIRITPNGEIAALRNQSVLFSNEGAHDLRMNVFISTDSVSISQSVSLNDEIVFSNSILLDTGWHSLSFPFIANSSVVKKQCEYRLNAIGDGRAYISEISITEENTLLNLISVCEDANDLPSNTLFPAIESTPFEFGSTPLINPGSNMLYPRSVLQFTPVDSAGFIVVRGSPGTNPTIGVFTSCSPDQEPVFYSDGKSGTDENVLLTNLTPGVPHYALIEQKSVVEHQAGQFRGIYFDIPRAQIEEVIVTNENWVVNLSQVEFYGIEPESIILSATGANGFSKVFRPAFRADGMYSGSTLGLNLPVSGTIRVAYRFDKHSVLLFSEPYDFITSTGSTSDQNLVLLNNQLSSNTTHLSIVTPENISMNSSWDITLYDLTGKKIYQRSYFPSGDKINTIQVDLTRLSDGLYIVSLFNSGMSWNSSVFFSD